MYFKRILLLCLSTMFVLSGCFTSPPLYNQTTGNVADITQRMNDEHTREQAYGAKAPPLVVDQGLYVDRTPISLMREPAWMRSHIVMRGDQLPFSYYSRTITGDSNTASLLTHYQVGLDQSIIVSMNYSGSVKGALDLLAAKSGYVYTVNGTTIYWQAFITKTFDIAFMPGTADYTLGDSSSTSGSGGSSGGGGGGGGSSGGSSGGSTTGGLSGLSSNSSLKGTLSIWQDLNDTIKNLLSPEGKVFVSQSTTSVTVRDRPSNITLIERYIKNLNKSLSRQVLVKIQIYEIQLSSAFNFGINWEIIKRGFMGTNFTLNANYGTPVSITPLSTTTPYGANSKFFTVPAQGGLPSINAQQADPNHITGVNIFVSALEQQGRVSIVSEPRVVCLNNQVSVINIVNKQGYAASVSSTALAGGSGSGGSSVTSSITPGTVVTGLILYVLPKIMNDKVYLQVSADLSSLVEIVPFTSGATGTSPASIQIPETNEREFNQRSMLTSGSTMILSGFKNVQNQTGAMQLFGAQALGGKAAQQSNDELVVLITPIILNSGSV